MKCFFYMEATMLRRKLHQISLPRILKSIKFINKFTYACYLTFFHLRGKHKAEIDLGNTVSTGYCYKYYIYQGCIFLYLNPNHVIQ